MSKRECIAIHFMAFYRLREGHVSRWFVISNNSDKNLNSEKNLNCPAFGDLLNKSMTLGFPWIWLTKLNLNFCFILAWYKDLYKMRSLDPFYNVFYFNRPLTSLMPMLTVALIQRYQNVLPFYCSNLNILML